MGKGAALGAPVKLLFGVLLALSYWLVTLFMKLLTLLLMIVISTLPLSVNDCPGGVFVLEPGGGGSFRWKFFALSEFPIGNDLLSEKPSLAGYPSYYLSVAYLDDDFVMGFVLL